MMNSPIDEIKNKLDIVEVIGNYIKLQKAGVNYRACCPFHNEKKPSFFINPARQIWHCFGSCSEGGDMFKFVMKIEGVEFADALRILAQKAGVELKREDPKFVSERKRLYEIAELACSFYQKQLEGNKSAKEYLKNRGVLEESMQKWRLGYSPENWDSLVNFLKSREYKEAEIEKAGLGIKSQKTGNYFDRFRSRIMFPIFNTSSDAIGFGGRIFKDLKRADGFEEAKYINSPATLLYDKGKVLYGLNRAVLAIRRSDACVLVEGYMDVIMSSQAGIENVVATSGTALTSYQLRILKRYSENLYTAFDMDLAGDSATKRGIDLAQAEGFNIKVVIMPGKDPADVALEDSNLLKDLINSAKSIYDFYFFTTLKKFDKNTLEGKKDISKTLLAIIRKIPNKIEQAVWIKRLSIEIGVEEENIIAEFNKLPIIENRAEKDQVRDVAIKSRREMLEEKLLLLILKFPEICNVSGQDLRFFSLPNVKIIDYLRNKENVSAEDLNSQLNYLYVKAETEEMGDPKVEFKECFSQLKNIVVKGQLSDISNEIKEAERENNIEKVKELIYQFNQEAKLLEA